MSRQVESGTISQTINRLVGSVEQTVGRKLEHRSRTIGGYGVDDLADRFLSAIQTVSITARTTSRQLDDQGGQ
jgi:hypothetical protein